MSDFSAYDIHRLDQTIVDALEDVDGWVTDMDVRADLDERGIAIAAAILTAQLAENHTHGGLAGFAALATIRRIQERSHRDRLRAALEDIVGMVEQFDTPRDPGRVRTFAADVGHVAARGLDQDR